MLKINITDTKFEFLNENFKIRNEEYDSIVGTTEFKKGYLYLPCKEKKYNRNGVIHWIRIEPRGKYLHCELNPNRYFATTRNNYQLKSQSEVKEVLNWLETMLLDIFKIKINPKGMGYLKLHYNIDMKLKEDITKYSKVFKFLSYCLSDTESKIYLAAKNYKTKLTGTTFKLGDAFQVNYDKGTELGITDINVKRFETRWDSMSEIDSTFKTTLVSKISIKDINTKIGELFEEHIFLNVPEVLSDFKLIMKESLIKWRANGTGWLENWLHGMNDYIIDTKMIKDVLEDADGSKSWVKKNYEKARVILKKVEQEQMNTETSFDNYRRLNEIYKNIAKSKTNLI